MSSVRAQIIECLRDGKRPQDYVAVAERIGRTIYYAKTVFAQLHTEGRIRAVGSVPGVRAPRSTYRPTPLGLTLLEPGYSASKAAAETLRAQRAGIKPAPLPAKLRSNNLWDVWQ